MQEKIRAGVKLYQTERERECNSKESKARDILAYSLREREWWCYKEYTKWEQGCVSFPGKPLAGKLRRNWNIFLALNTKGVVVVVLVMMITRLLATAHAYTRPNIMYSYCCTLESGENYRRLCCQHKRWRFMLFSRKRRRSWRRHTQRGG